MIFFKSQHSNGMIRSQAFLGKAEDEMFQQKLNTIASPIGADTLRVGYAFRAGSNISYVKRDRIIRHESRISLAKAIDHPDSQITSGIILDPNAKTNESQRGLQLVAQLDQAGSKRTRNHLSRYRAMNSVSFFQAIVGVEKRVVIVLDE
jgi:hypothetical protein